jgi:hypothetical protein
MLLLMDPSLWIVWGKIGILMCHRPREISGFPGLFGTQIISEGFAVVKASRRRLYITDNASCPWGDYPESREQSEGMLEGGTKRVLRQRPIVPPG